MQYPLSKGPQYFGHICAAYVCDCPKMNVHICGCGLYKSALYSPACSDFYLNLTINLMYLTNSMMYIFVTHSLIGS